MHRPFIVALLVLIASAITTHAQRVGSALSSSWTAPPTPWGDPDLQGNYTNKYETSTPFERPKESEGRRMEDITTQELAAAVTRRQEDTLALLDQSLAMFCGWVESQNRDQPDQSNLSGESTCQRSPN